MVLDTCCSGEGGRGRLEELCHDDLGLPILVEVVATASKVEHKEEWMEWLLFKVCVKEQKFETFFGALCLTDDVECSDNAEYNAKHAFVLGTLSKYLSNHPKEVIVSDSFALDVFNVHKNAVDTVDFTCRGSSLLPTGSPAIDVVGYSLQLLRDICVWESSLSETQLPVDSLLQTGLVKRLLKYLGEIEPPSTIRKSMARGQGDHQRALANGKQCVIDEENAYLREWGLLTVKNLLEGNEENQEEVSEFELQEPVMTPEIANIGLKVEIDEEAGRPKLVNTP